MTKMPGDIDPLYVAARRVLLDALAALIAHREALILIGAQAIYLHTGEGDFAVAPFTTDADIALDPATLKTEPALEAALKGADFKPTKEVGVWKKRGFAGDVPADLTVDLLVPEAVGGAGRRAAHLGDH